MVCVRKPRGDRGITFGKAQLEWMGLYQRKPKMVGWSVAGKA